MKKKTNQLILASVVGLIALSVIQGYLIKNTYALKKGAFLAETRQSIGRIEDRSWALDSLSYEWRQNFLDALTDYKINLISKDDIIRNLELSIDSINDAYNTAYQNELKLRDIKYRIKYQKQIQHIILLDSAYSDSIYNFKTHPKQIHIGESILKEDAMQINQTTWSTDHMSQRYIDGEMRNIIFDFRFITQDNIEIVDWRSIIFKQMISLLLLSLIIFITVIILLYASIKSLIKQKKIADVKTDFVNNITHELKTPLATLTLATKILQNDAVVQQPKIYTNTVKTIERQNIRLQKLIDQVLTNSMGYKDIQLNKEPIEIKGFINIILDDFKMAHEDESIVINRSFKGDKNTINVDKFYLTTALLNILENAVKYNDNDVVISVTIDTSKFLKIAITDNGKGIAESDKNYVFDKFFRAGEKEIHNVKGLGLGLYYTKQIVKAHGGYINLSSKIGKGTIFTISIPFD